MVYILNSVLLPTAVVRHSVTTVWTTGWTNRLSKVIAALFVQRDWFKHRVEGRPDHPIVSQVQRGRVPPSPECHPARCPNLCDECGGRGALQARMVEARAMASTYEDVAGILRLRWESLDRRYLEKWIVEIELQEQWKNARHAAGIPEFDIIVLRVSTMCRNIKTLFNFDPPVTDDEVRAASVQFIRKITGFNKPSKANEAAFLAAVEDVAAVAARLLRSLETVAPPKNREEEAAKARARAAERFGT